ncbi:MAG: Nramp family divalent metal transporter [Bacteroidota bacterium]
MAFRRSHDQISLSEVHSSVPIPKNVGMLKRLFAFAGPAYLVSVGYMDPGNWATDIEGGARFGYELIWVLLMSNIIAVILQTLSARFGIVAGRDLAQGCRENYPRPIVIALWIMCEIAIAACDLAEVLGTAIGLNLLFGIPLVYGVVITGADTMLFLAIQRYGIRKMEALILTFIATIGVCFGIEVFLSKPEWGGLVQGFIPHITSDNLYIAVGILGATVMPHNLYLHSALVQTRAVDQSIDGKRVACRYNLIDTSIALNAAFFVNAAILIVASAVFFRNGVVVTEIQQAYQLLTPLVGTALASVLFAVALISSGQSSTVTGTLAGQIVMEGFMHFKIRPVLRRLVTRLLAIIPAVIIISLKGDQGSYDLLILSQIILSLQLPFAVVPLIKFTGDRTIMGVFANKSWVQILAWICTTVIVALNAKLIFDTIHGWILAAGPSAIWIWLTVVPVAVGSAFLLFYVAMPKSWRLKKYEPPPLPRPRVGLLGQEYKRIGVAVDFGAMDAKVLSHAHSLATFHHAPVYLFHIVEGVAGQVFGTQAFDKEAREDRERLEEYADEISRAGVEANLALGFGHDVPGELVRLSRDYSIDILVMGGHGHRLIADFFLGTSVSEVRHKLDIPVLVVR